MTNSLLDNIFTAQKQGEARGIPSICSAHPWVLQAAMQSDAGRLLIESTCNQVNQFGGYTGMTPPGKTTTPSTASCCWTTYRNAPSF